MQHLYSPKAVLIVPLWNWNQINQALSGDAMRFNRTFMELKSLMRAAGAAHEKVLIVPLWNWNLIDKDWVKQRRWSFNRTFMELKSDWQKLGKAKKVVLIVPLWNWNTRAKENQMRQSCFNRTFMELKLGRWQIKISFVRF